MRVEANLAPFGPLQALKPFALSLCLALSIMAFSDAPWRLLPNLAVGSLPLDVTIMRAVIASMGFLAVAAHWERVTRLLVQNLPLLALILMAPISAFWSSDPAFVMQQGLMFLLLIVFALGQGSHWRPSILASAYMLAGLSLVCAASVLVVRAGPSELGFLVRLASQIHLSAEGALPLILAGAAMALFQGGLLAWMAPFILAAVLGLAFGTKDVLALGALVGILVMGALSIALASSARRPIMASVALVLVFAILTLFLVLSPERAGGVLDFVQNAQNSRRIIGFGFARTGISLSDSFGAGLGILGLGLGLLTGLFMLVGATVAVGLRALARGRDGWLTLTDAGSGVLALGAGLGAIIVGPEVISSLGTIIVLLASGWVLGQGGFRSTSGSALVLSRANKGQMDFKNHANYGQANYSARGQQLAARNGVGPSQPQMGKNGLPPRRDVISTTRLKVALAMAKEAAKPVGSAPLKTTAPKPFAQAAKTGPARRKSPQ